MDRFGNDFDSATGSVMTRAQLEDQRRKRGECITCGRKCFQKKLFKTIPITDHGRVLEGRCLNCHPLTPADTDRMPAVSRRATNEDLERFSLAQSNLPTTSQSSSGGRQSVTRSKRPQLSTPQQTGQSQSARSIPNRGNGSSRGLASRQSLNSSISSANRHACDVSDCSEMSFSELTSRRSTDPLARTSGHMSTSTFHMSTLSDANEEKFEALDEYIPSMHDSNGTDASGRYVPRTQSGYSSGDHSYAHASIVSPAVTQSSSPHSQEYNRRSQSSLRSNESSGGMSDELRYSASHRTLDRGGAYTPAQPPPQPPSQVVAQSPSWNRNVSRSRSNRGGSSHGSTGRLGVGSQRSLDSGSAASFDDVGSFHQASLNSQPVSHDTHVDHQMEQYAREQSDLEHLLGQLPQSNFETSAVHALLNGSQGAESFLQNSIDFQTHITEDLSISPGMKLLRMAGSNFVDILSVMHDFSDDIEVQKTALHELSEIQLSEDDSLIFSQIGGVHLIVNSMLAFSSDLKIQTSGCRAIWNASGTAQNQHEFVQANALSIIFQDMMEFVNDGSLHEQALAALANLAALESNLDIMMENGIVRRVVGSMTENSEKVEVLVKGCLVIANLSSHPSTIKKKMMEAGGGGALVIAMVMHPTAPELQEKALRGLRNLSANCDENKIELTNIGGIDAVIGAMQVHRDSAGVQEAGAWTLSNLASNVDSNSIIGECGGIDVLIRAMWVHSDVVSVSEWCCRALFTLSLNERNSRLVLEVGGIAAIVNSMQAHVDDSAVIQEMGCAILSNLAIDDTSKMRIVEEEALDAIVLAMVLYSDNDGVQARACQALLHLAIAPNLKAMQASNVSELVHSASERFPESCGESAHLLLEGIETFAANYR